SAAVFRSSARQSCPVVNLNYAAAVFRSSAAVFRSSGVICCLPKFCCCLPKFWCDKKNDMTLYLA
ncbi:hypothetical protein L9F63_015075, partial [Diploptera punctata]